jgi:hypothetical protein
MLGESLRPINLPLSLFCLLVFIAGSASLTLAAEKPEPILVYPSNSQDRTENHPLSGLDGLPAPTLCTLDVLNIQNAIELAGQTERPVMLMPGDFYFGDGSEDGDFVGIFNDVLLEGKGPDETRIHGGFCTLRTYDEVDVTIMGIHFDTPVYSAILVPTGNVTIEGNRFTGLIGDMLLGYWGGYTVEISESHWLFSLFSMSDPNNRSILPLPPGQPFPSGSTYYDFNYLLQEHLTKSIGTIAVSDNEFDIFGEGPDVPPPYPYLHASGVHFFGVFHEEDKVKSLDLTRNNFRNPGSQALRCGGFNGNTITVRKNVVHQREYGFYVIDGPQGIKMTSALGVLPGKIIIDHNELHTLGEGITLFLGSDSVVKSNTLDMPYPASVFGPLFLSGCDNATVGKNTFRGVGPYAISVIGESHHNTFWGNNIATFEASEYTAWFDELTSDNLYIGIGIGTYLDLGVNNEIR